MSLTRTQIREQSLAVPKARKPGNSNTAQRGLDLTLPLCALLALVTLTVYFRALGNPFLAYDDSSYVTHNLKVQLGLTLESIRWAFTAAWSGNWHPLTWLSHAIDCQLFGLNPAGHHLTSVAFHVLNVVILFFLLSRATGRTERSFVVAALFGLHPLNVESVAWIAERKNLLSTFFFLLAIGSYGWYSQRPKIARYVAVTILFLLGLMSKPAIVTLPFVLLLLDFWPLQRIEGQSPSTSFPVPQFPFWRCALEKVLLLLVSVGSCMVTLRAQFLGIASLQELPLLARLCNSIYSYSAYIEKAFWPTRLAVFYPCEGTRILAERHWALVTVCVLFLTGVSVAVLQNRSRLYLPVGWCWFLGTLIPMIGLVQVSNQAMADRYAYIPMIGIFVMVVWGAAELGCLFKFDVRWLAGAAIAVLSVLTWQQIGVWAGDYELWGHAIQVTRDSVVAETNFGDVSFWRTYDAPTRGYSHEALEAARNEALTHLRKAVSLDPSDVPSRWHLASALGERGQFRDAIEQYQAVLELPAVFIGDEQVPSHLKSLLDVGLAYVALGDCENGERYYRKALQMDAQNAITVYDVGLLARLEASQEAGSNCGIASRLQELASGTSVPITARAGPM
jgi:hypothetical protein